MGFLKRKLAVFCVNWGICKEKTRDVCIKCVIFVEIMRDFQVTWEICEEKMHDIHLNGKFAKRKHVIFT